MDISDILFSSYMPMALKQGILELMERYSITDPSTPVLIPTESNDDINGSQHVSNGGTDFSYGDASVRDIREASTLGYYEYFRAITVGSSTYTGNQYHGDGDFFAAVVVDPPEYAAEIQV